jgi:hypothetical protein
VKSSGAVETFILGNERFGILKKFILTDFRENFGQKP